MTMAAPETGSASMAGAALRASPVPRPSWASALVECGSAAVVIEGDIGDAVDLIGDEARALGVAQAGAAIFGSRFRKRSRRSSRSRIFCRWRRMASRSSGVEQPRARIWSTRCWRRRRSAAMR